MSIVRVKTRQRDKAAEPLRLGYTGDTKLSRYSDRFNPPKQGTRLFIERDGRIYDLVTPKGWEEVLAYLRA